MYKLHHLSSAANRWDKPSIYQAMTGHWSHPVSMKIVWGVGIVCEEISDALKWNISNLMASIHLYLTLKLLAAINHRLLIPCREFNEAMGLYVNTRKGLWVWYRNINKMPSQIKKKKVSQSCTHWYFVGPPLALTTACICHGIVFDSLMRCHNIYFQLELH